MNCKIWTHLVPLSIFLTYLFFPSSVAAQDTLGVVIALDESISPPTIDESPYFGIASLDSIGAEYSILSLISLMDDPEAQMSSWPQSSRIYWAAFLDTVQLDSLVVEYEQDTNVEIALPDTCNWSYQSLPNDALFDRQWGLHNTGQQGGDGQTDIDAPEAWTFSTGAGVVVAILDGGFLLGHQDMTSQWWENPDPAGTPEVGDTHGWDFSDQDSTLLPAYGDAIPWHGMACAGIVGARRDEQTGVVGVAYDSKIMALKVMPARLIFHQWSIAKGMIYAAENGARVLSMSIGCPLGGGPSGGPCDKAVLAAARDIRDNFPGVVICAATGNDGNLCDVEDPAAGASQFATNPEIIAVGNACYKGGRDVTSVPSNNISVIAPGGGSNEPEYTCCNTEAHFLDNDGSYTKVFGGTSAATPHVAGICALIIADDPTLDADEIREILEAGAIDVIEDPEEEVGVGWDIYTGYGIANAHRALLYPMIHLPVEGERLHAGANYTIKWRTPITTSGPQVAKSSLYYSVDGGPDTPIVTGLTADGTNVNTHLWDVPDVSSTNVVLKIKSWNGNYSQSGRNTVTATQTIQIEQGNVDWIVPTDGLEVQYIIENKALDGDRIIINQQSTSDPSTWRDPFLVDKAVEVVRGAGVSEVIVDAKGGDYAAFISHSGAKISGLTLQSGATCVVEVGSGEVSDCVIKDNGVSFSSAAAILASGTLTNCQIDLTSGEGRAIKVNGSSASVTDNSASILLSSPSTYNLKEGIWIDGSSAVVERNNLTFSTGASPAGIGISISSGGSSSVVQYNEILDARTGILVDAGTSLVKFNVIEEPLFGIKLTSGSGQVVENNTVGRSTTCTGSSLGLSLESGFPTTASYFRRNLVVNSETGFWLHQGTGGTGWVFEDNAYWDESQSCGSKSNVTMQHSKVRDNVDPLLCGGLSGTRKFSYRIDSDFNDENPGHPFSSGRVGALRIECASGTLQQDTTVPWTTEGLSITVLEDVTVPSNKSLTIEGGAGILFDEADESGGGSDSDLNEIIVDGSFVVDGLYEEVTSFRSKAQTPAAGDWYGIVAEPGASVDLDYVDIQDAVLGVSDKTSSPADKVVLRWSSLGNFETAGVYLSPTTTNGFNEAHIGSTTVDMSGAPYGVYIKGLGYDDAYNVAIDALDIVGDGWGTYGLYLDVHGSSGYGEEPDVRRVSVDNLTGGTGVFIGGNSPYLEDITVNDCQEGVRIQGSGSVVDTLNTITDCTTGLYVLGSVTVDVEDASITDCNKGVYTDAYAQGSFKDVDISGGSVGLFANSTEAHTFREGSILSFLQTGVSTNQNSGVDLGTGPPSDNGMNNIHSSEQGVIAYFKCKPYFSQLPDVPAQGNYWGAVPPPSSMFSDGVDYSTYLTSPSTLAKEVALRSSPPKPFLRAGPNPFFSSLHFEFLVPEEADAYTLDVFDVSGRLVRRWESEEAVAGIQKVVWNSRSNQGATLASGLYFVRLQAGKIHKTIKVLRLASN